MSLDGLKGVEKKQDGLDKSGTSQVIDNTREEVDELIELKSRILEELDRSDFPNLSFLYSQEVLSVIPSVLDELLDKERKEFYELLEKENEDISFDDLIVPSKFDYLFTLINHLDSVDNSDVTTKIIEEFKVKQIEFYSEQKYNRRFYDIHKYFEKREDLDVEQKRVIELRLRKFLRSGINLAKEDQEKLKEIDVELSKLYNKFKNNITESKKEFEYHIETDEFIKDLPKDVLENARQQAEEKGLEGYVFTSDPTGIFALIKYCNSEDIRKDIYIAHHSYASNGDSDNRANIIKILNLREQKASLLGYDNYSGFSLSNKMASSSEEVFDLIGSIAEKAKEKTLEEIRVMREYFSVESLEVWDFDYYGEKLKIAEYGIDEKELKNYFEYEKVIEYMFYVAKELYGLDMQEIEQETYNEDVKIFGAYKNGELISYYFLDPFFRKTKRGGAWADSLRGRTEKEVPLVLNVCNFQKSSSGKTLLTMGDVETIFHEFGHAMHKIFSMSKYEELSGYNVERDFIELPSQLNEHWANERESLKNLAIHHETGEFISDEILDSLEKLKTFNIGKYLVRQNEFALLDMYLHTSGVPSSVEELDEKIFNYVNNISPFELPEDYRMYTGFSHIFAGGYAAGYYSYMWADILVADVFSKIRKEGMFSQEVGEKYLKSILGAGTTKDAEDLFFDFMGRKVDNTAFMREIGFIK